MARPAYQDRIDNPENYPVIRNDDGAVSTHRMADISALADQFDPEGSSYDHATARKLIKAFPLTVAKPKKYQGDVVANDEAFQAWVWHKDLNDYRLHSASRVPRTGMLLKGKKHPTFQIAIEEDMRQGYEIKEGPGGRLFSIIPETKGTALDELGRITQNYALSTEDLFRNYFGDSGTTSSYEPPVVKPYEHPEMDWEPHKQTIPDAPTRPKDDWTPWEKAEDRLLSAREAVASVPGELAGILSLAAYSPAGALFDKQPFMDFFEKLKTKSDKALMSNPHHFDMDNNRSVYGVPWNSEDMALWAVANIGLDPGWAFTKSGRTAIKGIQEAAKFAPAKPLVNRGLIDPARRKFMQDTAVTAGVTGLGGIAGLKMMTKGAPEAAAKAADDGFDFLRNLDEKPLGKLAAKATKFDGVMSYDDFYKRYFDKVRKLDNIKNDWVFGSTKPPASLSNSATLDKIAKEEVEHMYKFYQLAKMDDPAIRNKLLDPKIKKKIGDMYFDFSTVGGTKGEQKARDFVSKLPKDKRPVYEAYLRHLDDQTDPPILYMDRHDPYMDNYGQLDKYIKLDEDNISSLNLDELLEYPLKSWSDL
jgi:hypothetical protein